MSSPLASYNEIAEQNQDYKTTLMQDIVKNNQRVEELMNATVEYQEDQYDEQICTMRNNLTREQKARLMTGESLESILNFYPPTTSRYYNTSDEAAEHVDPHQRFEYRIGNHLLMYELSDLKFNNELKTIDVPVIVYDQSVSGDEDWKETNYTITDKDTYSFALHLKNNR